MPGTDSGAGTISVSKTHKVLPSCWTEKTAKSRMMEFLSTGCDKMHLFLSTQRPSKNHRPKESRRDLGEG